MQFKEFIKESEKTNESLWSMAKGGWNTFSGGMTVADELLAKTMGDGTKGRMSGGFKQLGKGLRQIAIGDPPAKNQIIKTPQTQAQKNIDQTQAQKTTNPKQFLKELERTEKAKKTRQQPEYWIRLVQMYKSAKTEEERKEIRRKMRLANPTLYMQAVQAGSKRKQS